MANSKSIRLITRTWFTVRVQKQTSFCRPGTPSSYRKATMRKLSYAVLIASMMLETGVARAQNQQQPASQAGQADQQSPSQAPSQTPPSQEPQNQPVQPIPASRDPLLR